MMLGAKTVWAMDEARTASSASALARRKRVRSWVLAPSAEKNTNRSTPARSAASTIRQVAIPLSSSIEPCGWSRIEAARCTTVSTPRSALRNEGGSDRSPSAICTRTRSGPRPRGSRTRQRTGSRAAVRRRRRADPTSPVAPVSSSTRAGFHRILNSRTLNEDFRTRLMAYVIAEPCIGQKDNSCVEVCPVDCIHPTPDEPDYDKVEMLYIDPEEFIDCDACVEACPVDACFAEDQLPDEWQKYSQINADYFKQSA